LASPSSHQSSLKLLSPSESTKLTGLPNTNDKDAIQVALDSFLCHFFFDGRTAKDFIRWQKNSAAA